MTPKSKVYAFVALEKPASEASTSATRPLRIIHTFHFMSPEQHADDRTGPGAEALLMRRRVLPSRHDVVIYDVVISLSTMPDIATHVNSPLVPIARWFAVPRAVTAAFSPSSGERQTPQSRKSGVAPAELRISAVLWCEKRRTHPDGASMWRGCREVAARRQGRQQWSKWVRKGYLRRFMTWS